MEATLGFFLLLVASAVLAQDCQKACPLNYAPICGSDGQRKIFFDNDCLMNVYNCEQHTNLHKTELWECSFLPAEQKSKCQLFCPEIYAPVCATDGQKKMTFDNECVLNAFNCVQHSNLRKTELSECSIVPAEQNNNCQMICPLIYDPICATDGQTKTIFSNQCNLDAFNCEKHTNLRKTELSECSFVPAEQNNNCQMICPLIYDPICATDGQTKTIFSNQCNLDAFNCEQHTNLRKTELSECSFKPAQNCQSNCPKIYEPICATDGQKKMIFDNQCLLNAFNCEQHDSMKQTEFSECSQDCPTVCPFIYAPICATDGQKKMTFDNECNLKAYNCHQHTNLRKTEYSECSFMPAEKTENCPKICPDLYAPVCATDGVRRINFDNECLLNAFNCEQHANFRKTELSQCSFSPYELTQDCPKVCPKNYAPVCASDGRMKIIFNNDCLLKAFNCDKHTNLRRIQWPC